MVKAGLNVVYQGKNKISDSNNGYKEVDGLVYKNRPKWGRLSYYYDISYIKDTINEIGLNNLYAVIMYHQPSICALRLKCFCDRNNVKLIADTTEWYSIRRQLLEGNFIIRILDFWLRMYCSNKVVKNNIVISRYLEDYYVKRKCNVLRVPILNLSGNNNTRICRTNGKLKLCYCGSSSKKDLLLPLVTTVEYYLAQGVAIELDIVGCSAQQFETSTKHHIDCSHKNAITFFGRLTHDETLGVLRKNDFSVILRPNERYAIAGFPTKMVEAFSEGVSLIACDNGDISEYVKNGENGFLITPIDIEKSLKETIGQILLLDDNTIKKIREHALLLGLKNFNYEQYANLLRDYLERIH